MCVVATVVVRHEESYHDGRGADSPSVGFEFKIEMNQGRGVERKGWRALRE